MKPSPVFKLILYPLLALIIVQLACSFGAQPSSGGSGPPDGGAPAPVNTNAGQIVVSGAINRTYNPVRVNIGQFGPASIRLYMYEETPKDLSRLGDALTISLPADIQPGTYPFENSLENQSVSMSAEYDTSEGVPASYKSINGTLTMTAVGSTFSGQFQLTAADSSDPSKTIDVSGSFTDLPFNP